MSMAHQNVIRYFSLIQEMGDYCILMEYYERGDLRKFVRWIQKIRTINKTSWNHKDILVNMFRSTVYAQQKYSASRFKSYKYTSDLRGKHKIRRIWLR